MQTKKRDSSLGREGFMNSFIFARRDSCARAAWNGRTRTRVPFLSVRFNAFSTFLQVSICNFRRKIYDLPVSTIKGQISSPIHRAQIYLITENNCFRNWTLLHQLQKSRFLIEKCCLRSFFCLNFSTAIY